METKCHNEKKKTNTNEATNTDQNKLSEDLANITTQKNPDIITIYNEKQCVTTGKECYQPMEILAINKPEEHQRSYKNTGNVVTLRLTKDAILPFESESSRNGRLNILLDSGAVTSVAKQNSLDEPKYSGPTRTLTGFAGQTQKSCGEAEIDLKIGNEQIKWPMQVFPSLGPTRADAVLGRDFLANRVVLDWVKETVSIHQKEEIGKVTTNHTTYNDIKHGSVQITDTGNENESKTKPEQTPERSETTPESLANKYTPNSETAGQNQTRTKSIGNENESTQLLEPTPIGNKAEMGPSDTQAIDESPERRHKKNESDQEDHEAKFNSMYAKFMDIAKRYAKIGQQKITSYANLTNQARNKPKDAQSNKMPSMDEITALLNNAPDRENRTPYNDIRLERNEATNKENSTDQTPADTVNEETNSYLQATLKVDHPVKVTELPKSIEAVESNNVSNKDSEGNIIKRNNESRSSIVSTEVNTANIHEGKTKSSKESPTINGKIINNKEESSAKRKESQGILQLKDTSKEENYNRSEKATIQQHQPEEPNSKKHNVNVHINMNKPIGNAYQMIIPGEDVHTDRTIRERNLQTNANNKMIAIINSNKPSRFPATQLTGLPGSDPAAAIIYSLSAIPAFASFLENNCKKTNGIVSLLSEATYTCHRKLTLMDYPTLHRRNILDEIIFEVSRTSTDSAPTNPSAPCFLNNLKKSMFDYVTLRHMQKSYQKTSNKYQRYLSTPHQNHKSKERRYKEYIKAHLSHRDNVNWRSTNLTKNTRHQLFTVSSASINQCTQCRNHETKESETEALVVKSTDKFLNLARRIESIINPSLGREFTCKSCGGKKSIIINSKFKKLPDILVIQTSQPFYNTAYVDVPKTVTIKQEATTNTYKLSSCIIQLNQPRNNNVWVELFDHDTKCTVRRGFPIDFEPSNVDFERIKGCQLLFYELTSSTKNFCHPEHLTTDIMSIYNNAEDIFDTPTISDSIEANFESTPYDNLRKQDINFDPNATTNLRQNITKLCQDFSDVFSLPGNKLSHTTAGIFHLPMKEGAGPIHIKQFRTDVAQTKLMREMVKNLEADGVIERSFSPYNFPVFLRAKPELDAKGNKKMRMCVDFSRLNKQCVPYFFPLPRIDEFQESVKDHPYICSLDMSQGYHQVLVAPEDKEKLAFTFDGVHWQHKRVPFGLSTISGFFQAMMNNILSGLVGNICLVYVDDILVMAKTEEEMVERLQLVFQRLREYQFKLNLQKCKFGHSEMRILGLLCSAKGIRPDPERTVKVTNYPVPTTKKKLQAWLGLANTYRRFVPHFADISEPLLELLRKRAPYVWNEQRQESFDKLKQAITTEPVFLTHPDPNQPFDVCCDASGGAVGAVLEQEGHPVCFASKTLTPTERRYGVSDLEQYAVVFAMENWRHFLTSNKNRVFTDHKPLAGELRKVSQSSRLLRYKLRLAEFNFEVIYRKGKDNKNADAMSRIDDKFEEGDEVVMIIMFITRAMARHMAENATETDAEHHQTTKNTDQANQTLSEKEKDSELTMGKDETDRKDKKPPDPMILPQDPDRIEITDEEDKFNILQTLHDSPFGGHFGCNKTYARIKQLYHWKGMKEEIHNYVLSCHACQMNKKSRPTKMPLQITRSSEKPFDKIYVDILESLPESNRGNTVILSMIDDLTRFVELAPLPDQRAETIAKALFEDILSRYTFPKEIVSDRGANFLSNLIAAMCKLLKIKKTATTAYHPQSNVVERSHQWLGNYLRSIVDKNPANWDEYLRLAAHANNNTIHTGTKQIPMEALFGFTSTIPIALKRKPEPVYNHDDYLSIYRNKQQVVQQLIKECNPLLRAKNKKSYDKKLNEVNLHTGDWVLLMTPPRNPKWKPKYSGPYRIVHKENDIHVHIETGRKKSTVEMVHINRLKPYIGEPPG